MQALRHTLQAQPNGSALVRSAKQRARAALRAYEEGFDDSLTASYVSDATAVDTATPDSLGGALDDGAMEQSDAYSSLSRSEEASKEGGGRGAARPGPAGSAPRGIDLSTISFEDDKERSAQSYRRSTDNAETAGAANYVHTSSFFSKTQDDGGNSGDGFGRPPARASAPFGSRSLSKAWENLQHTRAPTQGYTPARTAPRMSESGSSPGKQAAADWLEKALSNVSQ